MGNWSSTSKSTPVSPVDASAFKEEKAPHQANRSAPAEDSQKAAVAVSPVSVDLPKPKINPSNNGGMRPLDALK